MVQNVHQAACKLPGDFKERATTGCRSTAPHLHLQRLRPRMQVIVGVVRLCSTA